MKKPLQEGINMKNLTVNEWNQFKIYFDFMIKSGYSELESKEQAYNKAIKNRVVGMFTSKNYRH
jgi:hypothetical protein